MHKLAYRLAVDAHTLGEQLRRVTVELTAGANRLGVGVLWPGGRNTVVTNAHVVRSRHLEIRSWDGRIAQAYLAAISRQRDLAVLVTPWDDLSAAPLGDAHALRVGDLVFAYGAPWGISEAVSMGVVHSVGRSSSGNDLIYADVRLAPGNSGGPLVNAAGKIVGINTAIVDGLGTAIPSHVVASFVNGAERDTNAA